jgi:hypothetical protein
MREWIRSLLLLCAIVTAPAEAQQAEGQWQGTLGSVGRIALEVRRGQAGGYEGTIEAVDQSPERRSVADLRVSSDTLSFSLPAIGGRFEGKWNPAIKGWSGQWTQRGGEDSLVLTPGVPESHPVVSGLDGSWDAALPVGGARLRIVLHIRTGPRGTIAKLDSPDQLATGLPVDAVRRDGDAVSLEMTAFDASFAGNLSADGKRIEGRWIQSGSGAPITFERRDPAAARSAPKRPQTPAKPYPYREVEASYDNPAATGVKLAGTLTVPSGVGPFPAALLISGSGGQHRDGSLFGHKPFLVLADHLTRNGIAVLRSDDRGVGQSTGTREGATSADFATDVAAGLAWLRTRPEIDPARVGLIGASEGGIIAPMIAADDPGVAFVVLLAAPAGKGDLLWFSQQQSIARSMGANQTDLDKQENINRAVIAALRNAPDTATAKSRLRNVLAALPASERPAPAAADELLKRMSDPWMLWFLNYDSAPALARVRVPILALNGSKDMQVDAKANLAAIRSAAAGNLDFTAVELPGLNHLFQTASSGAVGEYADIEETFAPDALRLISEWIMALATNHSGTAAPSR